MLIQENKVFFHKISSFTLLSDGSIQLNLIAGLKDMVTQELAYLPSTEKIIMISIADAEVILDTTANTNTTRRVDIATALYTYLVTNTLVPGTLG